MNNFKDRNAAQINKFRLISEFVEQSALISKNSSNLNQFISQVKRSRQVITFEPNFNVKYDSSCDKQNGYGKGFTVNSEEMIDYDNAKSFNSLGLKQSFAKSEIDQTTYESLMHEFMGSYLEQRLSSEKNNQSNFNYQSFGNLQTRSSDAPFFRVPLVQSSDESPINKDSQITFSGSKQSRIVNQNQQSRIVKEEYFLLDQLKNSKKSKTSHSRQKTYNHRPQDSIEKDKYFAQESYRLRAPAQPQKLRQSIQIIRQTSDKKPISLSKQKTKVHKINLIEQAQAKSILKSGSKKSDLKYSIAKQGSTQKKHDSYEVQQLSFSKKNTHINPHLQDSRNSKLTNSRHINNNYHSRSKQKQQPITIHVTLQKQDQKLNSKSRNDSKSPHSKSNNKSNSKPVKKIDMSNYLKTHKTFNVSSSKWKQQKHQQRQQRVNTIQPQSKMLALAKNYIGLSGQKIVDLDNSKRFIKIAKDRNQTPITLDNKQKRSQSQTDKTLSSSKKYQYEHSYNMGSPNHTPQSQSLLNTYRQLSNNVKSSRVQQNTYCNANEQQADIQKDREMIREIKKDLTKLIHKISSTSKKHHH